MKRDAHRRRCSSSSLVGARRAGSRTTRTGPTSTVPMPLKGEALTQSVLRRAAIRRGARRARRRGIACSTAAAAGCGDRAVGLALEPEREPARGARALGRSRAAAWSSIGTLIGGEDEFERWSGIVREYRRADDDDGRRPRPRVDEPCRRAVEEDDETRPRADPTRAATSAVRRRRLRPYLTTRAARRPGRSRDEIGHAGDARRGRARQRHGDQRVAVPLPRACSTAITAGCSSPRRSCGAATRCTSCRRTTTRRCWR